MMPDMAEPVIEESGQVAMLDLDGKEYNAYWVDEKQNLFIPNNPLHFKAHKLQVLLARLDNQAAKNPAQFNSKNYIDALNEYTRCIKMINEGLTDDEVLDKGGMDSERAGNSKAPHVGEGASSSLDLGISADNPFAGQGSDTA